MREREREREIRRRERIDYVCSVKGKELNKKLRVEWVGWHALVTSFILKGVFPVCLLLP